MSSLETVIQLEDLPLIDRPLESPYTGIEEGYVLYETEEDDEKNIKRFGERSFMQGILEAYKNHKSITLSPDIIWILILQGFSYHIAANKDDLRSMFVSFDEKKELTVKNLDIEISSATKADWMSIIDGFIKQIGEHTGKELTGMLEPKFSTTTNVTHTAGMVSIMSAMQHYFQYRGMIGGCGFPSITIEGTVEDWELMKSKVDYIAKYNLQWWTSELMPIIDEFINAKKGIINKQFWLDTLKRKSEDGLYTQYYIDGWLCRFFPYDKYGEKNDFYVFRDDLYQLPSQILIVPFILDLVDCNDVAECNNVVCEMNCEMHSGFFGVKETKTAPGVYNVKPIIGWGLKYNVEKRKKPKKPF